MRHPKTKLIKIYNSWADFKSWEKFKSMKARITKIHTMLIFTMRSVALSVTSRETQVGFNFWVFCSLFFLLEFQAGELIYVVVSREGLRCDGWWWSMDMFGLWAGARLDSDLGDIWSDGKGSEGLLWTGFLGGKVAMWRKIHEWWSLGIWLDLINGVDWWSIEVVRLIVVGLPVRSSRKKIVGLSGNLVVRLQVGFKRWRRR